MGLSYGWQKFRRAIISLVAGRSLKERLNYAIAYSLYHLKPEEEDLPKEIVGDFKEFLSFVQVWRPWRGRYNRRYVEQFIG